MTYLPDPGRYGAMRYRRVGRSGLLLPAVSLGLWQNFGPIYHRLGRHDEAITSLKDSLTLGQAFGNRRDRAVSLNSPGLAYGRLGRYREAIEQQRNSPGLFRALGDRCGQADALRGLGDALLADGSPRQAREAWLDAVALYEGLQLPEADEIREQLDALPGEASD